MSTMRRQCVKLINSWVEEADGNWEEVRKLMLEYTGEATRKTTGWRLFLNALDAVYEEMRPEDFTVPKAYERP